MIIRKIGIVLCTGALLLSATVAMAGGNTQPGAIKEIGVWEGNNGILIVHPYPTNPDGCTRPEAILLAKTHPHYRELYSLLVSSQAIGRKVIIYVQGCVESFPRLTHLQAFDN
jgi:hypothetical protein